MWNMRNLPLVSEWLARPKGDVPGREAALEELALSSIAARNPAAAPYRELTSDPSLREPSLLRRAPSRAGLDSLRAGLMWWTCS